jgi:hypothetical protein
MVEDYNDPVRRDLRKGLRVDAGKRHLFNQE